MAHFREGKLVKGRPPRNRITFRNEDMFMELVSVYAGEEETFDKHAKFLYRMLGQRDEKINISHKRMPLYRNHVRFIKSRPYSHWYIIIVDDVMAGSVYISKQNEIGLFIHESLKGSGIGKTALRLLLSKHKERPLYANINPSNDKSIRFFERNRFRYSHNLTNSRGQIIQNTYVLT